MTIALSPTDDDVMTALRSFLLRVVPGIEVVQGQQNRVPEPTGKFLIMWPIQRPRLDQNVDAAADAAFAASIAGTTMTVTAIPVGQINIGAELLGTGVFPGSKVVGQINGTPGGVGDYVIEPSQTLTSRVIASGQASATQGTEIVVQVGVQAPEFTDAGDMAATVATMFRDQYAVDFMAGINPAISPLYADPPRQTPFINAEGQYESRWSVDLHLQANQTVSGIPQEFADTVTVDPVSVEATP